MQTLEIRTIIRWPLFMYAAWVATSKHCRPTLKQKQKYKWETMSNNERQSMTRSLNMKRIVSYISSRSNKIVSPSYVVICAPLWGHDHFGAWGLKRISNIPMTFYMAGFAYLRLFWWCLSFFKFWQVIESLLEIPIRAPWWIGRIWGMGKDSRG